VLEAQARRIEALARYQESIALLERLDTAKWRKDLDAARERASRCYTIAP
jgi:hypothetical protein